MNTMLYWKRLFEDVVTGAATSVLVLLGDAADLWHVDWKQAVGVGGLAAVTALLKGLSAKNWGDENTTSYVRSDV